ncbi:MAG: putative nucleic acid-binding Zn ribbon protein [Salibacteraceae bacterium]|jgi:predicted nucleic acid-binding Zn ribbon protein|tara:strand:- start:103 stop:393 length:291 start_codon:yes stop_codon:yes gene_type:complete
MSEKNEHTLKQLLNQMLDKYKLSEKLDEVDLESHWEELMGTMIYKHTIQLKVQNKKLYIQLDSPVIRQELIYGKTLIIQKVNNFVGKELITDVVFR